MSVPVNTVGATSAAICAAEVLDVLPGVMNALRARVRGESREGLSVPQFRCLAFIEGSAGASITDVATFLGVSLATASAMVDRLARGGYVLASTAAEDRRRSRLHISGSGRALLKRMRRGAQRELAAVLGARSADELAALMEGLAVLRATFGIGAGRLA